MQVSITKQFKYVITAPKGKKFLPLENPVYETLIDEKEYPTANLRFNDTQLVFVSDWEYNLDKQDWEDIFLKAMVDVEPEIRSLEATDHIRVKTMFPYY